MISWKKIEKDFPSEFNYFTAWLEAWIGQYMSKHKYFNVATYFEMPTAVQLGIFYKFLSFEGCDLTINVLDESECCKEVVEYFAATHQQALSEKSEDKLY